MYFDNKKTSQGVDIEIAGTIDGSDTNAFLRKILVRDCFFRGGNYGAGSGSVATYMLRCHVTATNGWDDLHDIQVIDCEIENYGQNPIFIRGDDAGFAEADRVKLDGNTTNNNNKSGASIYSFCNIEAKSVTVDNNVIGPDNVVYATDGAITSGAAVLTSAAGAFGDPGTRDRAGETVRVSAPVLTAKF